MSDQKPDADWTDLAEVWTAPADPGGGDPGPEPDLSRALRRRARLGALNFHIEAWGAVLAAAAGGWFAFRHDSPLIGVAAIAFSLFALIATLWARRGLGATDADTPREALSAALRQARTGLKWARAGQAISLAGVAFLAVMAVLRPAPEVAPVYLGGGVLMACAILFYERHARRSRARIARHEAALAELD